MKIILIHIADILDNYIFRHKSHSFCNKIAGSNWWGNHSNCWYCNKFKG